MLHADRFPSPGGASRNALIVVCVVALHIAGLWALQSGLLRRAAQIIVPAELLSNFIAPPAPQTTPPPPPPTPPRPRPGRPPWRPWGWSLTPPRRRRWMRPWWPQRPPPPLCQRRPHRPHHRRRSNYRPATPPT